MKLSLSTSAVLAVILVQGLAAHSQDARFGLQATVSIPQGDLGGSDWLDGEKGYGVGAHALIQLKKDLNLIPRVDFTSYQRTLSVRGGGQYSSYSANADLKVSVIALGADFNYYVNGPDLKGLYLIGGLGYSSAKFEASATLTGGYGTMPASLNISETKGSFHVALGIGYDFTRHLSAEIRYQALTKYSLTGEDVSGPAVGASFIYRF